MLFPYNTKAQDILWVIYRGYKLAAAAITKERISRDSTVSNNSFKSSDRMVTLLFVDI